MEAANEQSDSQSSELEKLRADILQLKTVLQQKEKMLQEMESSKYNSQAAANSLSNEDIERYSRQLILPNFGKAAQLKLKQSKILIVGMGGLGCPAAQYLAAAGCGNLSLVDYDEVERNNLHRQVLHNIQRLYMLKVHSAKMALLDSNPHCNIQTHNYLLDDTNALELIEQHDLVLDCTDNVATRYLLNDACVLLNKPLISGSALQMDGQLTVYHYGEHGPCYRCLFPVPPPPETVTNCGDGGVLGAITGVIGALQAMEAFKIITGSLGEVMAGRLLIYDGARCVFRNIKLRGKRSDCDACSPRPTITRDLINYEQFCSMRAWDKDHALAILPPEQRITAQEYQSEYVQKQQQKLLIDVRQAAEFDICNLPDSINVPLKQLLNDAYDDNIKSCLTGTQNIPIILICRRGNDSQIATHHLRSKFPGKNICDMVGGLYAWHYRIDNDFPIY